MKLAKYIRLALVAVTAGMFFTFTATADIFVDFGSNEQTSPEQGGFDEMLLPNSGPANFNTITQQFISGFGNGNPVEITASTTGDIARQRAVVRSLGTATMTGGLNDMLIDWIGNDHRGGTFDMSLTIANLAAGHYNVRSYHTDLGSAAGQGNQEGKLDISVDGVQKINDFQIRGTNTLVTPDTTVPNFVDFTIVSDGTNPVEIEYLTNASAAATEAFTVLNGLQISALQPSTQQSEFWIDVDSSHTNPIATEAGWTSLDATNGNGSNVTVDTTTFTVFSADDDRNRATPNDLTGDFVFDDGPGQAVGLTIDNLPEGRWLVEVWAWDAGVPAGVGPQILGLKTGPLAVPGNETLIPGLATDPVNPIGSFEFDADGQTQYHVFTREDNPGNQSRFNALRVTIVPEPTSLLVLGAAGLLAVRRRRNA